MATADVHAGVRAPRRRARGVFWPIGIPLVAGLFLLFPDASIPIRLVIAAIGLGVLWAAFRFLRALLAQGSRIGARRSGPVAMDPALAIPGLVGYATFVVSLGLNEVLLLGRDDRTPLAIVVLALIPMLAFGAIAGLVAAVDRRGPYRLLVFVANAAYLVLAGLLVYWFLRPVS